MSHDNLLGTNRRDKQWRTPFPLVVFLGKLLSFSTNLLSEQQLPL